MEKLLIENRVRKLKIDEERLMKQIKIAQKSSEFADSVKARKQRDVLEKELAAQREALRIERQHQLNEATRNRNINNISYQKSAI